MSFSQDVKNEILHRKIVRSCCVTAAAYAVACFGKYFDDRGVVLQTENEGIAQLAQKLYARCSITGTVISKERGTGLIYEFSVKDPEQVQKMLNLFGHTGRETTLRIRPDCFKCQKCGSFFISTAFLCCGTATDPEKEYNIEFLSPRHSLSQQLEGILAQYEFNPHRAVRKGANTVYVKSSDHLEDLLTFMGAGNAAMRIMEQRMYNDMRNKTNRLSNCETANMGKTVQAAVQVRLAIEMLEEAGALETLPKPLQQAARLRMQYPEMPLAKLAEKFDPPVSKAGLSHRFKRIQEAAARLNAAASVQPEEQGNPKEPEPAGQDIAPSPQ
ncbi:DNA-binding protein WhiA [Gemmiger sp.]|uniref:DNA-binding protein WhiA n=1 Tax=Gemmiger sp. TaxID=2049027 RepID=UPI0025BA875B|nr:DNA-binding protein WhiA [Gemmiger sp.]